MHVSKSGFQNWSEVDQFRIKVKTVAESRSKPPPPFESIFNLSLNTLKQGPGDFKHCIWAKCSDPDPKPWMELTHGIKGAFNRSFILFLYFLGLQGIII